MKILHVSPYPTPHDARFLRAMVSAGEEVAYLPLDTSREFFPDWPADVETVNWHGLGSSVHLDPNAVREALPAFAEALRSVKPDLVQAGPACSAGYLTALAEFHPYIAMLWGYDILWDAKQSTVLEAMAVQTLQDADAILCDCNTVQDEVARLIQVGEKPVIQIPWGIELQRYNAPPPAAPLQGELGWQNNFVFVCARSWWPLYGIDTLLEGFRLAHQARPELRLLLLGDGPLRPMVESFITRHNLAPVVHLAGRVAEHDMPAYLLCGDVYVSCSRTDGSSVTLLEAMALQLPAIVSDIPGNREWVDVETGRFFPLDNCQQLAKAMVEMSQMTSSKRGDLGIAAKARVCTYADFNRNVEHLVQAHSDLCIQGAFQ